MGEDANGARQAEQPPCEGRCKTQFGIDNGGCPIDIHGDRTRFSVRKRRLNILGDLAILAFAGTRIDGFLHQLHQARCAWVSGRMETVAKAGDDFTALGDPVVQGYIYTVEVNLDMVIQFDGLFPGTTVDIAQHIDRAGHRVVQR